jgi:hypothetical protein
MAENFTAKQREIVARKLGYDGPMQGFDDFLNSSPALGMKYASITDKFATRMAKGGAVVAKSPVKKYQAGGLVSDDVVRNFLANNPGLTDQQIAARMTEFNVSPEQMARVTGVATTDVQNRFNAATAPAAPTVGAATEAQVRAAYANNPKAELNPSQESINYWMQTGLADFNTAVDTARAQNPSLASSIDAARAGTNAAPAPGTTTTTALPATPPLPTGAPAAPSATTYTAAQSATPTVATAGQAGPTAQAGLTNVAAPTPIAMPAPIAAPEAVAATAAPGVSGVLAGLEAQQGVVSETAKALAAQQAPETTAVAGVEAAQGVASTVQGAPTRAVEAGEIVSGPTVDMDRAEEIMARTQAAQGVVTEEMTIQGQLNKLTQDFDAGNPPPWAAASMRAATAQLAARGLGASSMAGQAIIQATLEAATPIAAADAKVFEAMGVQNLSNRQQTAMLIGQQRAAFLGQEFDQAFQTKVLNAAKISDIANRNFDAQTTIAIENSRLANSMDIANLSAKNAVVLGKMAAMSQLETQNLSNRQQVAVENAKAVLQMDIKNLDNRQQTMLFRAQEMNDALVSDAGFANATALTNATNALDAAKVSATLMQSAQQFNAELSTKVSLANALAANELSKFNAQQANAREEFNANMSTQISIANSKVLAEVSVANTAATNAANAVNAKNATDLSAAKYAQESQTYRDLLEMSWKTGESEKDRATQIAAATLTSSATTTAAKTSSDTAAIATIAKAGVTLAVNYDKVKDAAIDIFGD